MARIEEILPLSGPMIDNVDAEALASQKGAVRKRINMRPDNIGGMFMNSPIAGTVLRNSTLPTGTNKTLGWCKDSSNESIIWCIYNSNSNHCIQRIFVLTGVIQRIFYSEPTLGFTENTVINAEVIDGRLYWNDNTDDPKGFNIEKAVNYTNSLSGDAYVAADKPFDEKIFPYCKRPPRFKPTLVYESLTEFEGKPINFNNVRKKQWQSKYNYVYGDFQESVYSPISKTPLPLLEVNTAGDWIVAITTNNALKITINTGNNDVKSINVTIRDASNRNTGSFYLFKTIEKFDKDGVQLIANDISYDVHFLKNTFEESIDNQYGNAYFHNIPLSAKDLILLDGKYISMSMPKVGYELREEEVDYDLDTVEEGVTFEAVNVVTMPQVITGNSPYTRYTVTIPAIFYPDSLYQITYPCGIGYASATYATTDTEPANFRKTIRDFMGEQLSLKGSCGERDITMITNGDYALDINCLTAFTDDFIVTANITPIVTSDSYKGLKRGQYHPFSIVYNDGFGRYNIAFGQEELYSPLLDITTESLSKIIKPQITINSRPPEWAKTYRMAYIPYNSYTYLLFASAAQQVIGEGTDVNGIPAGKSFLKINQAILRQIEQFSNAVFEAYVWAEGDRVRRWGYPESYEILKEFTRTFNEDGEVVSETGFLVEGSFDVITDTLFVDNLEIYRPNRTPQDKVYYEIGEEFEVLEYGTANRRHQGNTQSQSSDLVTPAVVLMDFGDSYYRQRLTANASYPVALVEDNNYSDFYISTGINLGRGVVRTRSKQQIIKQVNRSENYIEDTEFNRLNIFLPQTESYTVSEVYGDITRIVERGETLKIIQSHKETSVYIGKNYAKDAAGGDIILATENTFGSFKRYEESLGSDYPRSIGASVDYLYFFDVMTGDFCRSASNGTIQLPLTHGMKKYFEEKAKEFRAYTGSKDIILGVEEDTECVYLSFILGTNIETIVFSENDENKGFLFFIELSNGNMVPENFGWHGDILFSFVNGQIYQHNIGLINQFYGSTRKPSTIEAIANANPQLQKSYENISFDADGTWTIDFEIEADNNNPNGQKSKLFPNLLLNREGSIVSPILRNLLHRDNTEDLQLLYTGSKMSGHALFIKAVSPDFNNLRELKINTLNQK